MPNFIFEKKRFNAFLSEVNNYINSLSDNELTQTYTDIFHCIDHTTLRDEDNAQYVISFCQKAVDYCNPNIGSVASVCVYPEFASAAKSVVSPIGMKVASVVGGFPTGQMPLTLKLQEIRYAIDNGADEVDFVINRGILLAGDSHHLAEEISSARSTCGDGILLKIILETGQLSSPELIYSASTIALQNGADFIKTSTGKTAIGATPEAAYSMLHAIRDFQKNSNRIVGFKVSGGVSTIDDALLYYIMTKKLLAIGEINNQLFRVGTSRLLPELSKKLTF